MTAALPRPATAALALAACALFAGCASSAQACESPYAASPQFKDCGFSNPPNADALPSAGAWKIWSRFLLETKTDTVPTDPIPVQALDGAQLSALDPQANHLVRLGHSSHLLKLQGRYWLIDPVFSERASPFQWLGPRRFHPPPIALDQLPPIAGLILSHDHYDHLDVATIGYLAQRVQRYFVPLGVKARLVELGVPADRVTELDWWQQAQFDGVELTATPAQHFSGRTLNDRDRTLWASWVIQTGGQRIFYSGDSGYFKGFREIGERFGGFDLAMMENGAYDAYWPAVHMTPEQSVQAFEDLRGKVLFSVHNSTFDLAFHTWHDPLDRIADLSEARKITLATPVIGEVLTVGRPRTNVRWWAGLK
ncbi:MBL fold metallo-hydrolase [Variovorax ginsengisoli]|uniref:MBL fold metallo-hydrolase n=1 Tax=Variovorax ginsengisoli TaxID=363844 RepID=A0ABT8S209_9BURK|nr:MBL fold metallo-hydrolase [Variovorax ginsengisoli]MDN8613789.1 MBL fold metallo-hydrolase [Variovorax ginsengisoli]MDO1532959.1 MBL fold metallo-hydrolase [Variovorax ginsengisoli]